MGEFELAGFPATGEAEMASAPMEMGHYRLLPYTCFLSE